MRSNIFEAVVAFILCGVLASALLSCAGQIPPSGGPPDTTPPEIIHTTPAPRTLNFHENKFAIEFNEYVDRLKLEQSIFVSPALGELTFEWGGTDVEISFLDSLRKNTTYVVTIGTDVTDLRSNRLKDAYSLAFSTGDHIDSASMTGKVFDSKPEGIMIFAYQLDSRNPDTLNPATVKPDYLTQTGKDGSFVLPYLSFGTYRLIAVRDEFKNLLYDPQADAYGVAGSTLSLDPEVIALSGIQFKMTSEDTTPPFLSSARSLDVRHILIKFSEAMDTSIVSMSDVVVIDTVKQEALPIIDLSFVGAALTDAQLVTALQESSAVYRVTLRGFRDVAGNRMIDSASTAVFTCEGGPDTTKPIMSISNVKDSATVLQVYDSLHVHFTQAIRTASFECTFALRDSLKNLVDGKFKWWSSSAVSFVPKIPLKYGMRYKLSVQLDSVQGLTGTPAGDSMKVIQFSTIDEKLMGSIKGSVMDDQPEGGGKIFITAEPVATKNARPQRIVLDAQGAFSFDKVPEGKYKLSAFRDRDGNGVYTYGKPFSFQSSERFMEYSDTLKVRARWPLEGVQLRFR